MKSINFHFATAVCIAVLFVFGIGAQTKSKSGDVDAVSVASEESAITAAIDRLLKAYSQKDPAAWHAAWTPKSPYMETSGDEIKAIFSSVESLDATVLEIVGIRIDGENAVVDANLAFDAVPRTGEKPVVAYQNGRWTLVLARENGEWKIFRSTSAERSFAVQLIKAGSDEEWSRLISGSPEFSIALLVRSIWLESDEIRPKLSFNEEERVLQIAATIAENSGDKSLYSGCLSRLASKYKEKGNYVKSLELENRGLALVRAEGDETAIAERLSSIGLIHLVKGTPREALPYFGESMELLDRIGGPGANWINLYRIGHAYKDMGDFANAMAFYQKSMDVLKKSKPDDELPVQRVTIANLYGLQGNQEQALENYLVALASFEKVGSQYGMSICFAGLAEAYQSKQQYRKAAEYEEKALAIRKATGNYSQTFYSLKRLGIDYASDGQRKKAYESFQEALELAKSRDTDSQLSEIYLELAKFEFDDSDLDRALESAMLSKLHADRTPELVENWEVYAVLGNIYGAKGQNGQAETELNKAIEIIENRTSQLAGGNDEKTRFFAGRVEPYNRLIELLVSQGSLDAAFSISERRRARALVETLKNGNPELRTTLSSAEMAENKQFRDDLVSLNTQLAKENESRNGDNSRQNDLRIDLEKKRLDFEHFRTRIYLTHPELKIHRGEMKPVTLSEVGDLLPDSASAILEFVVADNQTFVFAITKDAAYRPSLKVYPLNIRQEDLAARVEKIRAKLAEGDLGFQKETHLLYDLLIKPASDQLAGKTNLVIVPDGPLWDLPFQSLQDPRNQYLVERAAISYAPSLTALREMSKEAKKIDPKATFELLAFGDPTVAKETAKRVQGAFMVEKLGPLPEAARLVDALGKMYGPARSKIFTGADAREETAKNESSKYRIVLFATHGILNNVSPMYSHLVLAQNEKNPSEDGLLEAWEMKDLDLSADMVILSACETARGRVSNGEGVIGMSWALFIAGTPTTVASQWKVESSSTTELMLEFHRQLLSGKKVSKAEALRRASLKVMKMPGFGHPSYWAGFVIVGDAR